jgi:hypothetical protein
MKIFSKFYTKSSKDFLENIIHENETRGNIFRRKKQKNKKNSGPFLQFFLPLTSKLFDYCHLKISTKKVLKT